MLKTLKDRSAKQRLESLRGLFDSSPAKKPSAQPAVLPSPKRPSQLPDGSSVPQSPPFPNALQETVAPTPSFEELAISQPKPSTKKPMSRRPESLRSLSEILPFDDYQPSGVDQVKRTPDTFWKAEPYKDRKFENALYAWEASDLHHYPLYFEDPALERYGHTYPEYLQPFASAARFGVQLLGLPYQATIDPVRKPVYTLGWYRPGECTPKLFYQVPWNARAAAVQAGVTTGMFYLIP